MKYLHFPLLRAQDGPRVVWGSPVKRRFFGLLVALGVGLSLGYWLGGRALSSDSARRLGDSAQSAWSRQFQQEHERIIEQRAHMQRHLDALTAELGALQAQMMRLEGLGKRLVEQGGLDREEFNFDQMPPQGGLERQSPVLLSAASLRSELDRLHVGLADRELKLGLLERYLINRDAQSELTPDNRPVQGSWVSSVFGHRIDPITGGQAFHSGLDFVAKPGAEIHAAAAGIVSWSGSRGSYGLTVELNHGKGMVTRYAHNHELRVAVGDRVDKGQVIATLGNTGRSTGPHLHFEVLQDEQPIDPLRFLSSIAAERSERKPARL